jgi:hypothetical protein
MALLACLGGVIALPAAAAGINGVNNGMPNRISMNCTTAKGKPVTDPATCASEGCVDSSGKPVVDASVCAASPATGATGAEPASPDGKITKSRSNIQNN